MKNEILDDDFTSLSKHQPNALKWSSLIILWIGIAYSIINGLITDIKVVFALILLIIATGFTYYNDKVGIKLTLGVIFIGFLNLVDFFPFKISAGLSINDIGINFEFILFSIGILHYFTNKEVLSTFFKELLNLETPKDEIISAERQTINAFKRRFADRSFQELEAISTNDLLRPEAIKAAKELLNDKDPLSIP